MGKIAERLEEEIRPLLRRDRLHEGGYDCCGCATYDEILDHAIRIVREEEAELNEALAMARIEAGH